LVWLVHRAATPEVLDLRYAGPLVSAEALLFDQKDCFLAADPVFPTTNATTSR
jgi:hypothetical protein